MGRVLERLRVPALVILAAAAPLGAWLKIPIPGTSVDHNPAALGLFDLVIWPALLLALLLRLLKSGPRASLRSLLAAPPAGWFLLALAAWSGFIWPRLVGAEPVGLTAALKELVQLAEYGVVGFVAVAELAGEGERARKWALTGLGAAFGIVIAVGAWQYGGGRTDFEVGSLMDNRNALGAFLAVAVPFAMVMALGPGGCCCTWRWTWALLAGGGTLLVLSGGGLLGIVCGTLAGAGCLGRKRLTVAVAALAILAIAAQLLPRHNVGAALDSVRIARTVPDGHPLAGKTVLAMRYVRTGAELKFLEKSLVEPRLFFGVGPGAYTNGTKIYRPELAGDTRFVLAGGQTDNPDNYDVLADEPGTFNLFLVAGAELGLLGLLGFIWLFAGWAGRSLDACRRGLSEWERAIGAGAVGAVVGAASAGLLNSTWVRGAAPTLVLLVALAWSARSAAPEVLPPERAA